MRNVLALDIGGANIKLADGAGYAASHPFALWKTPEKLAEQLSKCLAAAPSAKQIVVTMTGELCDCYATKREGVAAIVSSTMEAIAGKPVLFYQTTGQFVSAGEATQNYLLTAASNWHALATFVARHIAMERGVLIDIGSTTTDIIPIEKGKDAARGRTDSERLRFGELVYTGIERSPVCAVVAHLIWREGPCPVAQEFFATAGDVHLLLGYLQEDPANTNTADGKPFTAEAAHTRLARMLCGDRESISRTEVEAFAEKICDTQLFMLKHAIYQVTDAMPGMPEKIVLSGHGEFLARKLLKRVLSRVQTASLNSCLGEDVSRCATAHALAVLASEAI